MTELASLPVYLSKQDNHMIKFSSFISMLVEEGMYVNRLTDNLVEIENHSNIKPDCCYSRIVIDMPKELSSEVTMCKFYFLPHSLVGSFLGLKPNMFTVLSGPFIILSALFGNTIKNPDTIMRGPVCKNIFEKLISTFEIFRCPKCGALTFKRESWEYEESRFTEDRIGHGLTAIAYVLFLGGHGAGGEWSQATTPREKKSGFTLTCTKCGNVKSVTTSFEYI